MPSTLSWIDHDRSINDAVYDLLNTPGVIDELGFGTIRDSISDTLFPGTSTLHTRLRYVLFIKWIYQELEKNPPKKQSFENAAIEIERQLVDLTARRDEKGRQEDGAFGKEAGGQNLKRLPSDAYWTALSRWNIRKTQSGSARKDWNAYIRAMESRRVRLADVPKESVEADDYADDGLDMWQNDPAPPKGFPKTLERKYLDLPPEEAVFLQKCMAEACDTPTASLFGHLIRNVSEHFPRYEKETYPWDLLKYPDLLAPESHHAVLLRHAEIYSHVVAGVTNLYYLLLAEADLAELTDPAQKEDKEQQLGKFKGHYEAWWKDMIPHRRDSLLSWNVRDFLDLYKCPGHKINELTEKFLADWTETVQHSAGQYLETPPRGKIVDEQIKRRERLVKGEKKSRFKNLDLWTRDGSRSAVLYNFRWGNVKRLLQDIYDGLHPTQEKKHAEPE